MYKYNSLRENNNEVSVDWYFILRVEMSLIFPLATLGISKYVIIKLVIIYIIKGQ